MKIVKKVSMGNINNVRGGLKDITEKERVATFVGIAQGYTVKTSETMGTSFAFQGEFKAYNRHGEEYAAPVLFVPSPFQEMLKRQLDESNGAAVEFAVSIWAVPDASAATGYRFETEPHTETKPSSALDSLTKLLPAQLAVKPAAALGLDKPAEPTPTEDKPAAAQEKPEVKHEGKPHHKGK